MAAKRRSTNKAPARSSSRKSRPAAKSQASSAGRKSASSGRPASKPRSRPAARPSKIKPTGSKTISARKPKAAPQKGNAAKAAPRTAQGTAPVRRREAAPLTSSVGLIHGIPPYQAKTGEPYMNERQLEHFRNILLAWKRELMEEVDRTVHHMQDEASNFPDPNDRATQESEFGLELRTRDRERKLLKKIDSALERIEDGSYGYCEETGEEIGLRRLEARPVATLSVEAQERRELAERQFRDREDAF